LRGYKNTPRRILRKTSNLFLFNSEPDRVDHDDFKESNFEDDRQPEIATLPSKPEVLISPKVRQISSKFQRQTQGFRLRRARKQYL